MELFEARDHYIIQNGEHALWCNRFDGSLTARLGEDICSAWNPVCLGRIHGVIGKMRIHSDSEWKLLLIQKQSQVGNLPGDLAVFRIDKITVLPLCLNQAKDLDIDKCSKHHFGISKQTVTSKPSDSQPKSLAKTWSSIKSVAENVKPKKLPFKIPPLGDFVNPPPQQQKEIKEKEKFEKRILEELLRMFNDSNSFYYCPEGDLTNSVQRLNTQPKSSDDSQSQEEVESCDKTKSCDPTKWKKADTRFFWNKPMLEDLINSGDPLADVWITPIIQGYVQINTCTLDFGDEFGSSSSIRSDQTAEDQKTSTNGVQFNISLISRRSRFRAGSRYKRRGVDEEGHVANYVETEQILQFTNHVVSFIQVRGSVPLYWSQTGIKYKPPPRIEKGDPENLAAFIKHFEDQVNNYDRVAAINVVDQSGKEKVIADAFLKNVLQYNSPDLMYVAFDFHEYCRGMRFENVSILTENIIDIIKDMRYCWVDQNGLICDQRGVFRVNCIDCLDRTNVVQSAIARIVLEVQCRKLGLLAPDEPLPRDIRLLYQQMWANTGDVISRQYAGTAALKSDYTRTGERKFSGLMKDGMNSANRYYINRVKDVYRQATIDLQLGNPITEYFSTLNSVRGEVPEEEDQDVLVEKEENMKTLIDDCKKMLIIEPEACLGSWGLIDCDPVTGDPTQQDMDIILLLSQQAYYVASYDDEIDQITSYQKVALPDLQRVEIGPAPALFKSKYICIRLFYKHQGESGYFHTLRTTSTRLFNNIVITIKNEEESKESLRAICESFSAANELLSEQPLQIDEVKLERKKSRPPPDIIDIASEAQLQLESGTTKLPSNHLAVPGKQVKRSSRNSTKMNISNISRTISVLNPVKKMKLSRLKRKVPFMPAVWYSKSQEDEDPEEVTEDSGRARILKGEKIITEQFGDVTDSCDIGHRVASPKALNAPMSIDDFDINRLDSDTSSDLSDYDLESQVNDDHVVMAPCGILMVESSQILELLASGVDFPCPAQQKSTSTELEKSPLKDPQELLKKSAAANAMKFRSMSIDVGDEREMKRSWNKSPVKEIVRSDLVGFLASTNLSKESELKSSLVAENLEVPSAGDTNGVTETETSVSDDVELKVSSLVKEENSEVDTTQVTGVTWACDLDVEKISEDEESWVNVNITESEDQGHNEGHQKDDVQLYHPSMKMSFSEGSIAATYHTELEEMNIDLDELELDSLTHVSPIARLKVKMSAIALPNMPNPASKRHHAQRVARHNRLKSQLRFKECKTKIILL